MDPKLRVVPVYSPIVSASDTEAVTRVLAEGLVSGAGADARGKNPVRSFEQAWAARTGMPHAVAVANGTAALELAVPGLGLGPGDEVICPAFTIISCVRAIVLAGATPILVDVNPSTWCLDPSAVESRISARTRAILGVHAFGTPYDHVSLLRIAGRGLFIIEDAAQAHGARVHDGSGTVPCGGLGDVSVFSFYANKPVTTGEGGMVLAKDAEVAKRIREASNLYLGGPRRFLHDELGHNYRLSGLQAALGLSQLERLDETTATKRRIAGWYRARLSQLPEVELQTSKPGDEPIYWMNGLVLADAVPADAAALASALSRRGIETRPFFVGFHEQPALLRRGLFQNERYPVTERLSRRGLYLPSGLDLDEHTVDHVVAMLQEAFREVGNAHVAVPEAPRSAEAAPGGLHDAARSAVFGPAFAEAYDALYEGKDYAAEVTLLEGCFERFGARPVRRVLDVGCGTGRHADELSRRGYEVVGVDRSASMLGIARRRAPNVRFVEADMADLELGERFDAAAILFAALSYQTTADGILSALRAARRHLEMGGVLIADVWFGTPADGGSIRRTHRIGRSETATFERWGTLARDPLEQKVRITYELHRHEGGRGTVVQETHSMHYFSPFELEFALRSAGFRLATLSAETDLDRAPAFSDLTALFVAVAS